jgi:hypothetical protein
MNKKNLLNAAVKRVRESILMCTALLLRYLTAYCRVALGSCWSLGC